MNEQLKKKPADGYESIEDYEPRVATREQRVFIDYALALSINKILNRLLELHEKLVNIEYSHLDTRETENDDDIYFINITGVWGRGPEVESEIMALASAMGSKGLELDAVSLPGHGGTTDILSKHETQKKPAFKRLFNKVRRILNPKFVERPKTGWNEPGDFDVAAEFVAAHIAQIKEKQPNRKIVINSWSMGGITALKIAAKYPDLIDGVILIDTPVFPQNFKKLVRHFFWYEAQKIKSVKTEKPLELKTKLPGLGIFLKRIKERNKGGIPISVVINSGRSLAKQDVVADGTLDMINQNQDKTDKKIEFLILTGTNDYLVPHAEQTSRLEDEMKSRGIRVISKRVRAAGHALTAEQPVRTGELIREWMEETGLDKVPEKDVSPDLL